MRFSTAISLSLLSASSTIATFGGSGGGKGGGSGSVAVEVIQAKPVIAGVIAVGSSSGANSGSQMGSGSAQMASGSAVAAAAPATHTVIVGGAKLEYNPSSITANVGDTVMFMFMQKNHTVTQSTFNTPCVKMQGGFDTGFVPNANGTSPAPTMTYTVNVTTPLWFYCKQKTPIVHCGMGMVFAINPTADKSFATFQSMAKSQNGTADAAASASAAATTTAAAVTLSVSNAATAAATSTAALSQTTNLVSGWNTGGNSQSCTCACFCGVAAFPVGDGVGAFGGMSGSLPAPW